MDHDVDVYFDFVSPYSYLALTQLGLFGTRNGIAWRLRPVVYGALLDATGLVGPAEIDVKRTSTMHDIVRSADKLGVPLTGPPTHPFRSLEALRAITLFAADPRAVDLAQRLARAAWGEGLDLTDVRVIADVVAEIGLDASDLEARIAAPEIKLALREATTAALDAGVFGVPTFVWRTEIFWGHDRMDQLAARIAGRIENSTARARALIERPRGIDRKARPG